MHDEGTRRIGWLASFASLLGSACVGAVPGGEPAPTPPGVAATDGSLEGMRDDARAFSPKVFYGTERPSHVRLSAGQVLAVGKFSNCSGALVSPRWVLTASHCGLSAREWFCMGPDAAQPNRCVQAARVVDNPSGDMTLVKLAQDAREVIADVQPIPLFHEDLDSSWIGRTAEAAGYGQNEAGEYGRRAFTAEPISGLWGDLMTIDGQGRRGVCFGDSGGPVMVVASDGSVRVAGDLSNGDESCVGQDNYTRVDLHREWIESHVGPTPGSEIQPEPVEVDPDPVDPDPQPDPEPDAQPEAQAPCGGLSYEGICDGDTARWCDQGEVRQRRCARWEMTCGWVDDDTGNYCMERRAAAVPSDNAAARDSDEDGVPDSVDGCSATRRGAAVWRSGVWRGCAGGQYLD